ncbi:MAG: hypothetical protein JWO63_1536 [Frankiales bacterium]|jgi:hypothetical protein|nr:hypothetical protein [Frankiales bacterium]
MTRLRVRSSSPSRSSLGGSRATVRPPDAWRRAPIGLAAAGLAALPVIYMVNPNTTHIPLCPLHAWTGLNCPLCGATRATYALLHGQFGVALHDNALYVLGLPALVLLWWRWLDSTRAGGRTGPVAPRLAWSALLVVGALFMLVRNLPFGAFLSPPA